MSEQLHTPEPWPVFTDIATMMTPDPEGTPVAILSWDDYIRARACVNFCTCIDTALLEEFPGGINGLSNIAIEKQRDDLLAALEGARESLDAIRLAVEPYDDIKPRDWKSDRANLRDAHTSAKETIEAVDTAIASVKDNTK